jgi:AmiR/NasT family two-component response regulator
MMQSSLHASRFQWAGPLRGTTPLPPPGRHGERAAQGPTVGTGIRVFVVEDEAVIALDLGERLAALGYAVCGTAARGEAAVRQIAKLRPDIVLMDIKLAGSMDGIEVAHQLHDHYDVPVVYLSAFADAQLIARATGTNCYGYLVKPFDERELHATLTVALQRFRASG